jgi:predicted nuclease of predicted toxin-antitoxin system
LRFVIDADLPRTAKGLLVRYGHEAIDVRDVGLASARDSTIAGFAQAQNACLLTGDWGFADIRNYPPHRYGGIVVLELPRDATAQFISRLIEALLQQADILPLLPGRLAVVEPGRVRLRPP